jgi:hypothetical protein
MLVYLCGDSRDYCLLGRDTVYSGNNLTFGKQTLPQTSGGTRKQQVLMSNC